jgi:hypothetical protein
MTKLHRLHRSEGEGVVIDVPPAVVNDPTRTAVPLWDDPRRRDAKAREMTDGRVWEHNPLAFVDHVDEFFLEVIQILVGRFVRAP